MNEPATPILEVEHLPTIRELHRLVHQHRRRQVCEVELPELSRLRLGRRLAIALITLYQRRLSARLNRRCMLEPSCSCYAQLAIAHQGVIVGCYATWKRLLRCRPENEGCIDYPKGASIAVPSREHRQGLQ